MEQFKVLLDKKEQVDILCIGEGEKALIELCNCLKSNLLYDHIKRI